MIRRTSTAIVLLVGVALQSTRAADISLDPSQRYYRDSNGQPVFLIGYYGWASVPDGFFIDHPSRYTLMMQQGAPYKINYIRISLGVNRMTNSTNPPSWNGQPTPVPFAYSGSPAKANLDAWDTTFWNGLKNQCVVGQQNGVIVHIAFFDGVELRDQGGESYGYSNSFWKPSNQTATFYSNPDTNNDGNIDNGGEFYRLNDFNNNVGLGHYQRLLIAKAISETAAYNNVFYEVGNELLSSDSAWYTAVITYAKSLTARPVTQNDGGPAGNRNGWAQHHADTPAQVKSNVAGIVGQGHPAWEDPDGPALASGSADDLRRAAWYSFVGGAAGWGGFTVDFWAGGSGFNTTKGNYYKNVQNFIQDSGVQFWNMVPRHDLVSSNSVNSCLANVGFEYVVYVLNGASVNLDLNSMSGSATYRLYDPKTNAWTSPQSVSGGAVRTFNKPAGADDWVVHVDNGGGATLDWNTLGAQQEIGNGITPGIATDAQGNQHIVYMNGGGILYRTRDTAGTFGSVESIPAPEGPGTYNSPHVVCDSNGIPHVVFQRNFDGSSLKGWYTNRIGGSWKAPVAALSPNPATQRVNYPRLALFGPYAFVGGLIDNPDGRVARLSNLSGTPTVDLFVNTTLMSSVPVVDSTGRLFIIGRNGPAGHYIQEYSHNLTTIGSARKLNVGTINKSGEPTAACVDDNNIVHVAGNAGATGIDPESHSEMWYNNTQRLDASQPCIRGLTSAPGTGWWGEYVYPDITTDAINRLYIAYRDIATGEGKMSLISGTQFASPVTFGSAITERLRWNAQLAPAPSGGVYVTWDVGGKCYIRSVGVGVASPDTDVSIDLGNPDVPDGMTHIAVGDGDTTPFTIGGRSARKNVNAAEDFYYYFGVGDFFAYQGNKPNLYVVIDYYDTGTSSLALQYDAAGASNEYKSGGSVALTNTNTWKQHVFHVTDAYFGNRQNNGADFRIGNINNTFYLDVVRVTTDAPLQPIIAEVIPDPKNVLVGIGYSQQLTLIQASPAPSWSIVQAPTGAQISASGLVTGWTPASNQLGNHTFEVQAINGLGSDTETWVVRVLSAFDFDQDGDVDSSDFGHFQECLSGAAVPHGANCADADADEDGDVDTFDFNAFLPCLAGANQVPGC